MTFAGVKSTEKLGRVEITAQTCECYILEKKTIPLLRKNDLVLNVSHQFSTNQMNVPKFLQIWT